MGYLIKSDYNISIQPGILTQIIQSNDATRLQAEVWAQEQIRENLVQKFDISQEFTDTTLFSKTATYPAAGRVYLDFAQYNPATAYAVGDYCAYTTNGITTEYICTTNTTGTFTAANWQALGLQYCMYYAAWPATCTYKASLNTPNAPVFNYKQYYNLGDVVYWKGYTYVCIQPTSGITRDMLIQYQSYADVPLLNVFPDDAVNNKNNQYWGTKTAYSVPPGTALTNTAYWTAGDNRSQSIVRRYIALALYCMHFNISPQNIPEHRVKEYDEACAWLKLARKGDIQPLTPLLQPVQGMRISWGSSVKLQNDY